MCQDNAGIDPSQGKDNAREHKPYRVGQMNAPGDDGDKYRHHEQSYGAEKDHIHRMSISGFFPKLGELSEDEQKNAAREHQTVGGSGRSEVTRAAPSTRGGEGISAWLKLPNLQPRVF